MPFCLSACLIACLSVYLSVVSMRPNIHCLIRCAQDLARRCIDRRWDPINAWDRWLPQLPVVESVGEGLQMPANAKQWLRFPVIAGVRTKTLYGEAVGFGAQGVVYPGRMIGSQTTTMAIKVYQNTPKSLFDRERSQLVTAKGCRNVVRLTVTAPFCDSSTGRGYMFME